MSNLKIIIKNLLANSLTGHKILVVRHTDSNFVGIRGRIIRESKQMLLIDMVEGQKWVSKVDGEYEFHLEGLKIKIVGKLLHGLANSRKKRKMRPW